MLTVITSALYLLEPTGFDANAVYEPASVLFTATVISLLQYVVLKAVIGTPSAAIKAWVPVSVVFAAIAYIVLFLWIQIPFRQATGQLDVIAVISNFALSAALGLVQGLLLAEMLGGRSTPLIWVVATVVSAAAGYAVVASGLFDRTLAGLNVIVASLLGNAVLGAMYGGVSGAFLLVILHRSTKAVDEPRAP